MTTQMLKLASEIKRLKVELRRIKYTNLVDWDQVAAGNPVEFLPIVHHTLLLYSRHVAQMLSNRGYQLISCSDQRFTELVFKIVRREFDLKPAISERQFLTPGFAIHKVLLMIDLIRKCQKFQFVFTSTNGTNQDWTQSPFTGKMSLKTKVSMVHSQKMGGVSEVLNEEPHETIDTYTAPSTKPTGTVIMAEDRRGENIKGDEYLSMDDGPIGDVSARDDLVDDDLRKHEDTTRPGGGLGGEDDDYEEVDVLRTEDYALHTKRIESLLLEGFSKINRDMAVLKTYVDNRFFMIESRLKVLDHHMLKQIKSNQLGKEDRAVGVSSGSYQ